MCSAAIYISATTHTRVIFIITLSLADTHLSCHLWKEIQGETIVLFDRVPSTYIYQHVLQHVMRLDLVLFLLSLAPSLICLSLLAFTLVSWVCFYLKWVIKCTDTWHAIILYSFMTGLWHWFAALRKNFKGPCLILVFVSLPSPGCVTYIILPGKCCTDEMHFCLQCRLSWTGEFQLWLDTFWHLGFYSFECWLRFIVDTVSVWLWWSLKASFSTFEGWGSVRSLFKG